MDILNTLGALILLGAMVGVVVAIPTLCIAGAISLVSKSMGKKQVDNSDLESDILEIKRDFEKAVKEYNITSTEARIQILNGLLDKKNMLYDENTNTFKRRTL
jgi:hypothetical protein